MTVLRVTTYSTPLEPMRLTGVRPARHPTVNRGGHEVEEEQNGLIACFGTWKDRQDETHVQKIFNSWQGTNNKFHVSGPGTRFGLVGRYLGGVFGLGWRARVREALIEIKRRPEIINWSIVGHSRGAMIALRLADRLRHDKTHVRNLVLLDPIGSFGVNALIKTWIPSWIRRKFNIENEQRVPDNVDNTWAFYAYDEERPHFRPTYLIRSTDNQKSIRCWFEGNHSDIGGYGDKATSNVVGGWIRLICSDDFGDSIVWPTEWQQYYSWDYHERHIDYTVGRITGLKRYPPFSSFLLVFKPVFGSTDGDHLRQGEPWSEAKTDRRMSRGHMMIWNRILSTQ